MGEKTIYLAGAEQIHMASRAMTAAADRMARAAAMIDNSNQQFLIKYEELVTRMEQATDKNTRSLFEQVFGKRF